MHAWKLGAASLVVTVACTSSDHDPDTSITRSPSTIAIDKEAVALLSSERQKAYADLAAQSGGDLELGVDVASTAVTHIALDLPPLAASPRDSARKFVDRWQLLLDDRVGAGEYVLVDAAQGCADAVVTFDRYLFGMPVIGSRLTLHFDDRGHLVYVTNGVAPVLGAIAWVDPWTLPGARPLASVVGQKIDRSKLPRVPVLAPLPDGSGVHKAELVGFIDDRGKQMATIAVGDVAITGAMDPTADDHPQPRGAPDAFVPAGEATPSYVTFRGIGGQLTNGLPIERNPIERAFRFLEANATIFHNGEARCQFMPRSVRETPDGEISVRLAQRHATLPIFATDVIVTLDGDRVASVLGHAIDNLDVRTTPALSASNAISVADGALDAGALADPSWQLMIDKSRAQPAVTRLGVLPVWAQWQSTQTHLLVWQVQRGAFTFYVDAQDGHVRNASSGIEGLTVVTDAHGANEFGLLGFELESVDGTHGTGASFNLDTSPGRAGGSTSAGLLAVANAYAALGWFGQNGRGSNFIAHTNVNAVTVPCQNSFFDSTFTQSAFFCLGWATTDVIGHEVTHGVIAQTSNLAYQDESGAINEAFADLMSNLIFREPGGSWIVGDTLRNPDGSTRGPLRNMANFAHMSSYIHRNSTCDAFPWSCDSGFVHFNSGIVNKAHQLLADGDTGWTGIGRDKLMVIAFQTMTMRLPGNARMNDIPLAERDVCEGLVARGARDLTGAPFTASDCWRIAWAFQTVGVDPRLVSGWSPPALGFTGTTTFHPSLLDVTPGRCAVQNVEANLVQLSGAQTIDLDPMTTTVPSSVTWMRLSSLTLRVPPGTPPFPIGTPFMRHTVDWTSVYGYQPSFYTNVIPTVCSVVPDQQPFSPQFDENFLFGGGMPSMRLGPAGSAVSPSCSLTGAELELLGAGGEVLDTGMTPSHTITWMFLFIPLHFTSRASAIVPPVPYTASPGPHDLSGTFSYSYDFGRGVHVRWRYHFTGPAGTTCTP